MDLEGRIRTRIEAILINDARNTAELERMADEDEPWERDPFEEERNLYQRILNNYRNAVSEVSGLLEENVGFLSAFYHITETIKEKKDLQEICAHIVDGILRELRPEYCSIVFFKDGAAHAGPLHLEGVREDCKFLRMHSGPSMLGSREFEEVVARLASEAPEGINIEDVYRENRFNTIDFPGVVRSLVSLPIVLRNRPVGALILSHSQPRFFHGNHVRVLRILASFLAHLTLLTAGNSEDFASIVPPPPPPSPAQDRDLFSIVLLGFECPGESGPAGIERKTLREIRSGLEHAALEGKESLIVHGGHGLLALLPGVPADAVPERVRRFGAAFREWKSEQTDAMRNARLSFGFATCEDGEDLARTVEVASLLMHPEEDPK